MDEEHIQNFDVTLGGQGRGKGGWGGGGAVALKDPKSILYKHSHVAYQIEGNEEWCKNFALGACLGITRGQKVGFWVLFLTVTQLLLGFLS